MPTGAPLPRQIEAILVYEERLAIAADLGMDTRPGSAGEAIARREARRVAAGFPDGGSARRTGGLIDAALAAFEPLGGLRLISISPRTDPSVPLQQHGDCPPQHLGTAAHAALDRDGRGSKPPASTPEAP